MVFYWGLIPEKIMHVDTSSLKEDFMKDVTNDVYGKVKCTRSDVTISVVGLSQLPKSMSTHSVQWQYLQHCMLGYQATSEDQIAGWLGRALVIGHLIREGHVTVFRGNYGGV